MPRCCWSRNRIACARGCSLRWLAERRCPPDGRIAGAQMPWLVQRLLHVVSMVAGIAAMLATAAPAGAQDLEPRAYAANPVGAAFLLVAWARSSGGVVTDPTLPVDDIEATIDGFPIGIGYTFGIAGKVAQAVVGMPYAMGQFSGNIQEQ